MGIISTLRPLDREEATTRLLPLLVGDAGGLSATVTLTITLADLNDNPMKSAAKTVHVTRITVCALSKLYIFPSSPFILFS